MFLSVLGPRPSGPAAFLSFRELTASVTSSKEISLFRYGSHWV